MKTSKVTLSRLRNDEHFQFHSEFKDIVIKHNPRVLGIGAQFAEYTRLYNREDDGIKKIRKSALTAQLMEADKARDDTWSGLIKMNEASLKHFDTKVVEAGKRLKILFGTYGNVAVKPLNEQTSAVYNILQELQGDYAADVTASGIENWVEELKKRNEVFRKLMQDRFSETALKSGVSVREARILLDRAYKDITDCINVFVLLDGAAAYEHFIRSHNVVAEKYSAILARRLGNKKVGA